jgi:hypothetical protein
MEHEYTIVKLPFDVDLLAAYIQLEKIINNVKFNSTSLFRHEYLENMKLTIEIYCKNQDQDFHYFFDQRLPIIVESSVERYETYLAYALLSYDIIKIPGFLDYQQIQYSGKSNFLHIVDHYVDRYLINNSPFNNDDRRNRIENWVREKKRSLTDIKERGLDSNDVKIKSSSSTTHDFKHYLKTEDRRILDYLIANYSNSKAGKFANMIFSLFKLQLLDKQEVLSSQRKFYDAIQNSFINVGTRQALNYNISLVNKAAHEKAPEILACQESIQSFLTSLK